MPRAMTIATNAWRISIRLLRHPRGDGAMIRASGITFGVAAAIDYDARASNVAIARGMVVVNNEAGNGIKETSAIL